MVPDRLSYCKYMTELYGLLLNWALTICVIRYTPSKSLKNMNWILVACFKKHFEESELGYDVNRVEMAR